MPSLQDIDFLFPKSKNILSTLMKKAEKEASKIYLGIALSKAE